MAQNGRLISQKSTWELNLTVLQRMDHHIEDILFTAGHVTLYEFDVDKCQWSRKDVEGSLFVVKRRTKPRFQFIVMNRRSTENLVEDLLDDFEYEVQLPYLLYRNAAQEVNGIWFYNSRECEGVANMFSRILSAFSKNTPKRKVFSPQGDEFQELEAVPTPATVEGPLEPPSAPATTEDPLEHFFSNALQLNAHEPVTALGVRSSVPIHTSSVHPPIVATFTPALAMPPPPSTSSSASPPPISTNQSVEEEAFSTNNSVVQEVPLKPYFFVPPPLPSSQRPTLHPPPVLQPSVGAPLLQPFPPPAPSSSLASPSVALHKPSVSRDGVRDALVRLVQNDRFIDMVYEELVKAHKLPV